MLFTSCGSLQKSLEVEDLGPKRITALEKEAEEWRMKAEDAVASIQDITVTYFAQTSKALAGRSCQDHLAFLSLESSDKPLTVLFTGKDRPFSLVLYTHTEMFYPFTSICGSIL